MKLQENRRRRSHLLSAIRSVSDPTYTIEIVPHISAMPLPHVLDLEGPLILPPRIPPLALLIEGSQHRKQKISYATSGINPKDLDILDDGSEDEIQSLTLEERSKRFVDAGVGLSIPATRLI